MTGAKIGGSGVYSLTMEEYHGDCCDGPSVSASRLHQIIAECPAKMWETSPLNPKRVEEKTTTALGFGKAAHALVLGEPEFNKSFVVAPYDDFRTKEARAWRDGEARTVLKAEQFECVVAMADAQRRSPQVARAFQNGKPEQSIIIKDEETDVWIKARPDWLPDDLTTGYIIEYKSARSIHPRKLGAAFFEYGYHLQGSIIIDAAKQVFGADPLGLAHVCQEKTIPYLAELKMLTPEQVEFGRHEYRRALRIFARCWEAHLAGKPERIAWPGYTVDASYVETPYYIAKQMENPDDFDRYHPTPSAEYDAAELFAAG